MKKILLLFGIIALTATAFWGCEKEKNKYSTTNSIDHYNFILSATHDSITDCYFGQNILGKLLWIRTINDSIQLEAPIIFIAVR